MNRSFSRLAGFGVPATKVLWLSNNRGGRCNDGGILSAYDAAAEAEATRRGATFVDTSEVLERHFARDFLSACCGDDLGIHRGAVLRFSAPTKSLVASAFEIQRLLGALCGGAAAVGGPPADPSPDVEAAETPPPAASPDVEAAETPAMAALRAENERLREQLAAAEARAGAAEESLEPAASAFQVAADDEPAATEATAPG